MEDRVNRLRRGPLRWAPPTPGSSTPPKSCLTTVPTSNAASAATAGGAIGPVPPTWLSRPSSLWLPSRNTKKAVIIQSTDPQIGQEVTLAIEKEAMLVCGSLFAFAMVLCVQCEPCTYPEPCRYPHLARPSMDAYGVDIGKTLEPLGFKVSFDPAGKFIPAWYSLVLV
jgi:hypothetical protein